MGSHSEVIDAPLANTRHRRGRYEEILVMDAIADNFPISSDMPPVLMLQATAARDLLMPADSAAIKGLRFTIVNTSVTAGAVLTLKTSADAALTPAITIAANAATSVIHGGGTGVKGWRRTEGNSIT